MVKNPTSIAGDVGSIPGQGAGIPDAMEQVSLSTIATEPMCSRVQVPQREGPELQLLRPGPQLESEHSNGTSV